MHVHTCTYYMYMYMPADSVEYIHIQMFGRLALGVHDYVSSMTS